MKNIIKLPTYTEGRKNGPFSETLKCRVSSVQFKDACAHLYLSTNECCDMGGAIAAVEAFMPDTRCILTYAGCLLDTCYVKVSGHWKAVSPNRFKGKLPAEWSPTQDA